MKQEELPFPAPKIPEPVGPPTLGQQRVINLVQHLKDNPIVDFVRKGMDLDATYDMHNGQKRLQVLRLANGSNKIWSMHNHAFGQMCKRLHFAPTYAYGLLAEEEEWAYQLAIDNINKLLDMRGMDKKFLIRTVNGQVRGFMSNAYGRFDTVQLVNTFSKSCLEVGAPPFDGFWSDLRIAVQGALENDYIAADQHLKAGVMLKHSDFGLGAMEVRFFIAVNGRPMVGRSGMHKIHRGRRLKEDPEHNDTLMSRKSTELSRQMHTLIHQHLAAENISAVMAEVELAGSTEIDVDKLSAILMSLELSDDEAKLATDAFEGIYPGSAMPPGSTLLRLASTIAWIAEASTDVERKLELMETAGSLIMKEKH